jgi:hypothetical protein
VVSDIDRGVNPLEVDEVAFDPITKRKIFNVDMACPCRGFLGVSHGGTAIIVFVCNGRGFLGYVKVPQYTTDKERHSADITSSHEFGFRGGERNCGLELRLVGNGAAGQLNTDAAE